MKSSDPLEAIICINTDVYKAYIVIIQVSLNCNFNNYLKKVFCCSSMCLASSLVQEKSKMHNFDFYFKNY